METQLKRKWHPGPVNEWKIVFQCWWTAKDKRRQKVVFHLDELMTRMAIKNARWGGGKRWEYGNCDDIKWSSNNDIFIKFLRLSDEFEVDTFLIYPRSDVISRVYETLSTCDVPSTSLRTNQLCIIQIVFASAMNFLGFYENRLLIASISGHKICILRSCLSSSNDLEIH